MCAVDEPLVERAVLEQEPADGVHQRDVAPGGDGDVQRGVLGRGGPAGVDDDQLESGSALRRAFTRSKVTGWASAMLLPQTAMQSAWSMSA